MKLEIIIPTYKRPEKLKRLLASIKTSKRLRDIEVFVVFDNRDTESFLDISEAYEDYRGMKVYLSVNKEQEYVFKIWNEHLKTSRADGVIVINDDTEFINEGLDRAIECFENKYSDKDVFIGFEQDLIVKKVNCKGAMGLIGSVFADRFQDRQCYCPEYTMLGADNELWKVAERLGKFHYLCNPPVIKHYVTEHKDATKQSTRQFWQRERDICINRSKKKLLWGVNEGKAS